MSGQTRLPSPVLNGVFFFYQVCSTTTAHWSSVSDLEPVFKYTLFYAEDASKTKYLLQGKSYTDAASPRVQMSASKSKKTVHTPLSHIRIASFQKVCNCTLFRIIVNQWQPVKTNIYFCWTNLQINVIYARVLKQIWFYTLTRCLHALKNFNSGRMKHSGPFQWSEWKQVFFLYLILK